MTHDEPPHYSAEDILERLNQEGITTLRGLAQRIVDEGGDEIWLVCNARLDPDSRNLIVAPDPHSMIFGPRFIRLRP